MFQFPLRDYGLCDGNAIEKAEKILGSFSSLYGIMVSATNLLNASVTQKLDVSVPSTGLWSLRRCDCYRRRLHVGSFSSLYGIMVSATSRRARVCCLFACFSSLYGIMVSATSQQSRIQTRYFVSVPSTGLWSLRLEASPAPGSLAYEFQFPLRDYGLCDPTEQFGLRLDPQVSVPSTGLWSLRRFLPLCVQGRRTSFSSLYGIMVSATHASIALVTRFSKFQFPLRDYGLCDDNPLVVHALDVVFQFPLRDYGLCDHLPAAAQARRGMFQFPLRDYGLCDIRARCKPSLRWQFQFPLRDYGLCDSG